MCCHYFILLLLLFPRISRDLSKYICKCITFFKYMRENEMILCLMGDFYIFVVFSLDIIHFNTIMSDLKTSTLLIRLRFFE